MITQQPKTSEDPKIVDTKPVIIEHPKTSHILPNTIRRDEKVSQVGPKSSLYSDTIFWIKKKNEHNKTSPCW